MEHRDKPSFAVVEYTMADRKVTWRPLLKFFAQEKNTQDSLAGFGAPIAKGKTMGEKLKAALQNGWGKVILGSSITAIIFLFGVFMRIGGIETQVRINTGILAEHIKADYPISAEEHYSLKVRMAKDEADIAIANRQIETLNNALKDNAEVLKDVKDYLKILRSQQRAQH